MLISGNRNVFNRWKKAVLSLLTAGKNHAAIPPTGNGVIVVLTQYQVQTSFQAMFTAILSAYVFSSLKAAGNIMAEAYYEQGDTTVIWVMERWRSADFYNSNRGSGAAGAVNAFTETGDALLREVLLMEDLVLFYGEFRKAPATGAPPLSVMLFIDVKTGAEEEFRQINQAAMPAVQQEEGLLTFQLSQVVDHKSQFVVFKKFYNREALQHHLKSPAIAPVIRFLQTSIKEPPFEKAYHHLIEFAPLYRGQH